MISDPITRRSLATHSLGTLFANKAMARSYSPIELSGTPGASAVGAALATLERRSGGRLGVLATNSASGSMIAHRADERFPMCSTHKWLVGAAILSRVEQGQLRLDQRVPYSSADLLDYAPVTKKKLAAGFMTVDALCEAAVRWSDNTEDNLLLRSLGGPSAWTRYARSIGDEVSRLDRYEPDLNSSVPGDSRETLSVCAFRSEHVFGPLSLAGDEFVRLAPARLRPRQPPSQ